MEGNKKIIKSDNLLIVGLIMIESIINKLVELVFNKFYDSPKYY